MPGNSGELFDIVKKLYAQWKIDYKQRCVFIEKYNNVRVHQIYYFDRYLANGNWVTYLTPTMIDRIYVSNETYSGITNVASLQYKIPITIENDEDKWQYLTFKDFWDDDYLDGYKKEFTSPSGDKMVAFGKYGHD